MDGVGGGRLVLAGKGSPGQLKAQSAETPPPPPLPLNWSSMKLSSSFSRILGVNLIIGEIFEHLIV